MPFRFARWPAELDGSLPSGSDPISEGNDWIAQLNRVLRETFPNLRGPVTASHAELSQLTNFNLSSVALRSELPVFATQEEAQAGTSASKMMSPLLTASYITARIATRAEAEGGSDNSKLMTPLRSSELLNARLASQAEALGGTDNAKLMTPLRTKEAIGAFAFEPVWAGARPAPGGFAVLEFTHNLGTRPRAFFAGLECLADEHGYVAGEEVPLWALLTGSGNGLASVASGPNALRLVFRERPRVRNFTNGDTSAITPANWQVVVRIWK